MDILASNTVLKLLCRDMFFSSTVVVLRLVPWLLWVNTAWNSPEESRGFENVVSSKWVTYPFCPNCPFKSLSFECCLTYKHVNAFCYDVN